MQTNGLYKQDTSGHVPLSWGKRPAFSGKLLCRFPLPVPSVIIASMNIRQDPENSELDALHDFVGSFAGKRVLEIGCGNGRLTFQYAAEAQLVHAIDPSEKKIAEAREKMPDQLQGKLEFWDVGIENFFAPEKYDTVLLSWSL